MKKQHYIILLHPIEEDVKTRVDFDTEIGPESIIELLKIKDYKIYQFILPDYQYVMAVDELRKQDVKFDLFEIEVKTWFGLGRKTQHELLIYPKEGFYYPYQYGGYFYLFSKRNISKDEFISWINNEFPNRFSDFDDTYAGINYKTIKLLNETDYVLVTNHDYQSDFGITADKKIINILLDRLKQQDFDAFELEAYEQKI